jgi:hypothetical protein
MADKSMLEKVAGAIALVSVAVAVTGTKGCQEDYEVGAQTSITKSPDTTASTTPTAVVTGTVTITPVTAEPTSATPAATATNDVSAADDEGNPLNGSDPGLLQELSVLGEKGDDDDISGSVSKGGANSQGTGNWLGKGFDGSNPQGDAGTWEDTDGDGFSNSREESSSSDPSDANSVPTDVDKGQLESRVRQLDSDMDGLLTEDEMKRGTNPNLSDSDGDGRTDGAEVVSGGDPLDVTALYVDADGDGLSNSYEEGKGFNPNSNDSDSDGLRDDIELVVGSNPLKIDSDGDGISDGREYDLNSDPLLGQPDKVG